MFWVHILLTEPELFCPAEYYTVIKEQSLKLHYLYNTLVTEPCNKTFQNC